MALIEHLERIDELPLEHVLAPAVEGLRGEHGDGVLGQPITAECRFSAPDRQQDAGGHAEALLDCIERGAVLAEKFSALRGKSRDRRLFDVVGGSLNEFRLPGRSLSGPPRQIQIRKAEIRLNAVRRSAEGLARDSQALRLWPKPLEPFAERGIGRRKCIQPGRRDPHRADHDISQNRAGQTAHEHCFDPFPEKHRPAAGAFRQLQQFGPAGR